MSLLYNFLKTIQSKSLLKQPTRSLYYWINKQFNALDVDRKKEIGPDLSCAEWILRNGGSVKWKNGFKSTSDYNELPKDIKGLKDFHLNEIDASDTNIMINGFDHFKGCKYIEKLILHNCYYIDDKALKGLDILKESLMLLTVSSCKNVTDVGIENLKTLTKLQTLSLSNLPSVKNMENAKLALKKYLPKCNIQYK